MKIAFTLTVVASIAASPLMAEVWFQDSDADGYGNSEISIEADTQPLGYVLNDGDCDDGNDGIFEGCGLLRGNSQGNAALAGLGVVVAFGAIFGSGGNETIATTGTGTN